MIVKGKIKAVFPLFLTWLSGNHRKVAGNWQKVNMSSIHTKRRLSDIYGRLMEHYKSQNWWPAEDPFEVMVGAILTQSTAWTNVEKGITNLKRAGALSPQGLRQLSESELARLIHPCGYFNAKTKKLKAFTEWFGRRFGDSLKQMCSGHIDELRLELLEVYGIGEETADSILLYACQKPVFVIDAYTRRIIDCLGIQHRGSQYRDYQTIFMDNLPSETALFNEYHALLVALGKGTCKKQKPRCEECCLKSVCKYKDNGLIY
jgi:endonuclease III related protein